MLWLLILGLIINEVIKNKRGLIKFLIIALNNTNKKRINKEINVHYFSASGSPLINILASQSGKKNAK